MIEALNKIVDHIENFLMTILMFAATVVTLVQVTARYGFNNSLYWSEEFILYSLISMSFLAAGMGVRYSAHISVDALYAFAGPRLTFLLKLIASVFGMIFAGTMVYYGSRLYINTSGMGQLSPATQIPVAYIYLSIPITGVFMLIRYVLILKKLVFHESYTPPSGNVSAI